MHYGWQIMTRQCWFFTKEDVALRRWNNTLMLKLYWLNLKILVLLLKSVVSSHATMIMTNLVTIIKDHHLTLWNEKLTSKIIQYTRNARFLPFLQYFFSNLHGFALLHPMISWVHKKQFFYDNNYHYYVKVLLISETQYRVNFDDPVIEGPVIVWTLTKLIQD